MTEPNFSLSGKIAAVTGASRGIGKSIAAALAGAGANIVLMARDEAALGETQRELAARGYSVSSLCVDVGNVSDIDSAFDKVSASFGKIDILVNNAGVEQLCPSLDVGEALWDRIMEINLKGAFFCAQAAARRMKHGGAIVNVCSLTSEVGVPHAAPYGASKSGLAGLTRALAAEWAQKGIRVNGIGPGYFRTALTEALYQDEQWQTRMLEKIPLRRFGNLEDLSGAAVYLCSNAAAYVTGQIIYVDGGYLASI